MNDKKIFFHVDIDAFFASVHQIENPDLKGLPVIVGQEALRGVVSTCSYEARKYGVHSAMPVMKAKQLCPQGIFISPDFELYLGYSKKVMSILRDFGPEIQQISIDEAFVNMSGTEKLLGKPEYSARKLKEIIKKETGLTVSIGIAENKYLAKIASDYNKPDGLTVIPPGEALSFIKSLPLKKLWGIGPKTLEKLRRTGITETTQVLELSQETLKKIAGNHGGEFIYSCVRGIDPGICSEQTDSKSISTEHTFGVSEQRCDYLESMLLEMANELRFRLLNEQEQSRTLCIKIRYDDFKTETIQTTRQEPFLTIPEVFSEAKQLFYKKWNGQPLRLLGLGFHNIEKAQEYSQNLFPDEKTEKQIKLEKALAKIQNKYKNGIKNARFLILILFLTVSFFLNKKVYCEEFPVFSRNVFNWQFGDKEVELNAGGTWDIGWTDFGMNFSSLENSKTFGFLPGVLTQDVDLSLNLEMDSHWFFNGYFSKSFSRNFFSAGYKNTDKTHNNIIDEITIGNLAGNIPLEFNSINLNDNENKLSIAGKFSKNNVDVYSLINIASENIQEKIFSGYNEISDSLLSISEWISGRWFIIPADGTTLGKINSIKIFVETDDGIYNGSDGRKYKLLGNSEFIFIKNQGIISLKKNYTGKITVSFYDEKGNHLTFNDSQIITDTVSFFSETGIDILPYLISDENKTVEIDSESTYIIRSINNFNVMEICSRYYIPGNISINSDLDQKIKLVYKTTKEELKDYSIRTDKESFSVSEFSYFEVYTGNSGNYYTPSGRFPLVKLSTSTGTEFFPNPGLIYIPPGKIITEENLCLGFEYTLPADTGTSGEIFVDYNINPETIRVYRGSLKTTEYDFDESTGILTLGTPPNSTEIIRVTYQKKDSNTSSIFSSDSITKFQAVSAMNWNIFPGLNMSFAGKIQWPLSGKKYSDGNTLNQGDITGSGKIAYSGKGVKITNETFGKVSFEDTTGLYRIMGFDKEGKIHYLKYDWLYSLPQNTELSIYGTMFSAENLIYPVYRKTLSLDSYGNVKADSTGTIAEGQKGPYTTGYSDNSGMVMNLEWLTKDYYPEGITEPWTGGILNWEESSLVTNGSTVNLIMNLQPTELFSGIFSAEEDICDIYIQFGVPGNLKDYPEFPEKTEEGDFFPAEETNVVTWKISGEDTTAGVTKGISTKENDLGKWQNIEIFLTEEQKVKIGNNTAIRLIVKPRVKGNQWASCKLQIREIMTSGMPFMISGGLKAAINKDPLYGSENSLENGSWGKTISSLNDDSNSVLEIQYTRTLSSLNPIEQGENSLSAYIEPVDGNYYKNFSFYIFFDGIPESGDKITISLGTGGSDSKEKIKITIPVIGIESHITPRQWAKISADLINKKIYFNGKNIPEARIISGNDKIFSFVKIQFETGAEEFRIFIDELHLENSIPLSQIGNYNTISFSRVWDSKISPLELNFDIDSFLSNTFLNGTNAFEARGDINSELKFLNLSLKINTTLSNSTEKVMEYGSHELNTDFRYVNFHEIYNFNGSTNGYYRSTGTEIEIPGSGLNISAKLDSEKWGYLKKQDIDTSLFFSKGPYYLTAEYSISEKFNKEKTGEDYFSYYKNSWSDYNAGDGSLFRNQKFYAKTGLDFSTIDFFITGETGIQNEILQSNSNKEYYRFAGTIPFIINDNIITLSSERNFYREIRNRPSSRKGDFISLKELFSQTRDFLGLSPFGFFSEKSEKVYKPKNSDVSRQEGKDIYKIKWERSLEASWIDLILPQSTSFSLKTTGSTTETDYNKILDIEGETTFFALNIFGNYGAYPVFNWYREEQLYNFLRVTTSIQEGEVTWNGIMNNELILIFNDNLKSGITNYFSFTDYSVFDRFEISTEIRGGSSFISSLIPVFLSKKTKSKNFFYSALSKKPEIIRTETAGCNFYKNTDQDSLTTERTTGFTFEHKLETVYEEAITLYFKVNLEINISPEKILTGNVTSGFGGKISF